MRISETLKEKILRYYYVEKWRVGTISTQLNVHHTTIKRILSDTGLAKYKILVQKSMIDDYLPFILETLERHATPPLQPADSIAWLLNEVIQVVKTISGILSVATDPNAPQKLIFAFERCLASKHKLTGVILVISPLAKPKDL